MNRSFYNGKVSGWNYYCTSSVHPSCLQAIAFPILICLAPSGSSLYKISVKSLVPFIAFEYEYPIF